MNRRLQAGFSMVELAVVILIMGLLLGGLVMPLAAQRDNARLREGQEQLESAIIAIEGYAMVNGHVPCPATPGSAGVADVSGGACTSQHGFVPATTLDLSGPRNTDNLLLDPWGSPVRYSVTAADADADGNWDFVTADELRQTTMPLLQPDLAICTSSAGSTPVACASPGVTLSDQAPLVVYSLGKDWAAFSSPDQQENAGATLGGGPSGSTYPVAADVVFVTRIRSDLGGSEFDDLLLWPSANRLYSRMVEAGRLP